MRDRIKAKLRGRAGETIAETLLAVLLASLALVMLAGAISSAGKLVTTSKTRIAAYYEGDSSMVSAGGDTISLTVLGETNQLFSSNVTCKKNAAAGTAIPVIAYKKN